MQSFNIIISLQGYILMLIPDDLDLPKRVHYHTLIFTISSWFFENESRFFIYVTVITYQVKFNHSVRTSYNTYWNIISASNYADAGISCLLENVSIFKNWYWGILQGFNTLILFKNFSINFIKLTFLLCFHKV